MATKFGRYELLERISAGGMAEVFKASIPGAAGVEKIVAIKRILPQFCDDERFVGMFIEEARISANLNHTNIGQVYEFGEIDGRYYIAMEFIPGKDLATLQEHFAHADRVMPLPMALRIVLDTCAALHHAHSKVDATGQALRIVHRDVSPPNVLVSYEGAVKLIDFGIAKAMARSSKTATGLLKGKYGYLSPEQAEGKEIDHRSDIFSLGTVLHELVSGQRLFVGESDMATLMAVRSEPIPIPSQVNPVLPEGLDHVVMTALERDRERRYQRALDFYVALEGLVNQSRLHFSTVHLGTWMAETFGYGKSAPAAKPMAGGFKHIVSLQPEPALVTGVRPRPQPEPPVEEKRELAIDTLRDAKRLTPPAAHDGTGETRITSESAELAAMLARRGASDHDPESSAHQSEETRGRGIAPLREQTPTGQDSTQRQRHTPTGGARRQLTPTGEEHAARQPSTPTGEPRRPTTPTGEPSRKLTPTGEPSRKLTPTGEPSRRLTPTGESRGVSDPRRRKVTPSGPLRLAAEARRRAAAVPEPVPDEPPPPPEEEVSVDSAAITLKPGLFWARPSDKGLKHSPTALGVGSQGDTAIERLLAARPRPELSAAPTEDAYDAIEVDQATGRARIEELLDQTVPAPPRPLPEPQAVPSFAELAAEDDGGWDEVTSDLANPAMADRLAAVQEAIRAARDETAPATPATVQRAGAVAALDATVRTPALDATVRTPALDDATAQLPSWNPESEASGGASFDDVPTSIRLGSAEAAVEAPPAEVVLPIERVISEEPEIEPGWSSIRTRAAPTDEVAPLRNATAEVVHAHGPPTDEVPPLGVEPEGRTAIAGEPPSLEAPGALSDDPPTNPATPYQLDQRSDEIPMPGSRAPRLAEEFGDEPTCVDPGPPELHLGDAEAPAEAVHLVDPQELEGDLQPAPAPARPRRRWPIVLFVIALLVILGGAGIAAYLLLGQDGPAAAPKTSKTRGATK